MDLLVLTWTFLWLNLLCIGGGLSALPEMERQVVAHGWATSREFVDGFTLAQLTPGPNMLVAAFVGYRAHGLPGAILAGVAMFLPSALLSGVISSQWKHLRGHPWADAATRALAPLGVGLAAAGVYTIARNAVTDWPTAAIAAAAALVVARAPIPTFVVILAGGLAGRLLGT